MTGYVIFVANARRKQRIVFPILPGYIPFCIERKGLLSFWDSLHLLFLVAHYLEHYSIGEILRKKYYEHRGEEAGEDEGVRFLRLLTTNVN